MDNDSKKKICILGSTGSIGTQALEVIGAHPDLFEAYVLTAGRNADLLIAQARRFQPAAVVIADEGKYDAVKEALADLPIQVYCGEEALCQVCQMEPVDTVLTALVGFAGLRPTVAAIKARKTIALANKETLVVAGDLVCRKVQEYKTAILPVDSEHSAIFQCLAGEAGELVTRLCLENRVAVLPVDSEHSAIFQSLMGEEDNAIEKIILTASGGPFRTFTPEQMQSVTAAQALRHPNWDMGAKITIDSATMMNKGFEVIEARWLFDVPSERIQVVVHPQSILHSAVEFEDGAVVGQMGMPDMKIPIQLALSYPRRLKSDFPRVDWYRLGQMTFEEPDLKRFPSLAQAYRAIAMGGGAPCVLNAANEVVNLAFREGRCRFLQMADIISECLTRMPRLDAPTLEDYLALDRDTRQLATSLL